LKIFFILSSAALGKEGKEGGMEVEGEKVIKWQKEKNKINIFIKYLIHY